MKKREPKNRSGIDWSDPAAVRAYRSQKRRQRPAPSDRNRGYAYAPKSKLGVTGQAHVTPEIVHDIRRRAAAGESQNNLAREYGLSHGAVSQIVRHITWKDIDGESRHGRARLTWTQVREIRARHAAGEARAALAAAYGVGVMTVSDIVRHKTWKEEE